MLTRLKGRLSPTLVVALTALFVALGGPGYAATGGNFVLGNLNSATSQTSLSASGTTATGLSVTNTNNAAGATALALNVPAGHAPMTVNRSTKVVSLNADWLDGLNSTNFLQKGAPATVAVAGTGGVVDVTNTGGANGVRGRTSSGVASGVYGENTSSGGYGVAGRATASGAAVYGDNSGGGYAGYFEDKVFVGGDFVCDGCIGATDVGGPVANATNAEKVDGASIVSNQVVSETQFTHILDMPGFGYFYIDSCDGENARIAWQADGTGTGYVTWNDFFHPGDVVQGNFDNVTSTTNPTFHSAIQIARNTGTASQVAAVMITANAADCVFSGQAIVQPG